MSTNPYAPPSDPGSATLAESSAAPTTARYRVLAWLCSLSMITYIDRVCIMQVQDEMQTDLGLTRQQFSWVFSAFALAYAAFEVPSGWLGDLLGPRKVLTRIIFCWLVFTALTGCVPRWDAGFTLPGTEFLVTGSLALLLCVRFLFGFGEAGAYPNIARAARNWFPFAERGRAQGLIWTFGRWGGAVAPVLIITLTLPFEWLGFAGWRGAFLMLGVLGVVWLAGFATFFRNSPQEHPGANDAERYLISGVSAAASKGPAKPSAGLSWASVLTSPTLWSISFMYFCSNSGWSFFITYSKPYLQNDLKLEGWLLHFASGAPLLCGGVGCLLGGFLTDSLVPVLGRRWGRTSQGLVAYALGGTFFLVAVMLTGKLNVLAFGAICLASFVKDFAMAASWATTLDIGHRYSGTVAGVMNTVGNLGTMVSPPLVAWLVVTFGREGEQSIGLFYYATMFFVAAGCWFFINPKRVIVYSPADSERLHRDGTLN